MLMTVTARHCEIAEDLRLRATQVLDRLDHVASRAVDGTVVFDMVDHKDSSARHTAEIRLHLSSGEVLIGHGESDDHRTALDQAEARLRHQLGKNLPRSRDRRRDASELA
ncbi:MAG TPA: HPF/RaiA family ribosome-associated protein [Gemmatimonadales bacterium]|nr:HPF/RaiA family ribosome-associated protein [Gemmatimonadales bacterium]